MAYKVFSSIFFFLFFLSFETNLMALDCVDKKTQVTLTATLSEKTFAGLPNFHDIKKGDQAETYVIAKLNSSACLNLQDFKGRSTQGSSQQLQLVFPGDTPLHILSDLYSKELKITGTLFEAKTAHQFTALLMTVNQVDYLVGTQLIGKTGLEYHEVLEKINDDTDQLVLSVRKAGTDEEVLRHILVSQAEDENSIAIELGDYQWDKEKLTLYSYWAKAGPALGDPVGVREQLFSFTAEGKPLFQWGKASVEVGLMPKDFQADFIVRAVERSHLKNEVTSKLKEQIHLFTGWWKKDSLLSQRIQQPL